MSTADSGEGPNPAHGRREATRIDPVVGITIFGIEQLFDGDLRALVDTAVEAEAAGVDQVVLPDHVVIGPRTDRYPFGSFPAPPDQPWPEPLTTLAAIASRTTRLRLATGVLIAPLRPPTLLAKTVATLDGLSGGRVDLGVGSGWQQEEFEASSVPFADREALLDDHLRACAALWRSAPASYHSDVTNFDDVWCVPRPGASAPAGVAVWFAGPGTARTGRRIAELGVGWLPIAGTTPAQMASGLSAIRDELERAGRDPGALGVRVTVPVTRRPDGPDLDATMEAADEYVHLGATGVTFPLVALARHPAEVADVLQRIGSARWSPAR